MFLENNTIDIAMISETKLTSKNFFSFRNYQIIRTDRPNVKNGGGTAIIIHNRIPFSAITYPNSLHNKSLEFSVAKITTQSNNTLILISIYARHSNKLSFINELYKIFTDFKLTNANTYHIIAGDFNARHPEWGSNIINARGRQMFQWYEEMSLQYRTVLYPAAEPTFPSAGSFLDYCLADARIELLNIIQGKIKILPYDSDHSALFFEIDTSSLFDGINFSTPSNPTFNYKKANWRKFQKYLMDNYNLDIPFNRNLTIDEIDSYIINLEETIADAIDKIILKNDPLSNPGQWKYINNRIKILHSYKNRLITILHNTIKLQNFRNTQVIKNIKKQITEINNQLYKEFQKTTTAYWEAKSRSVNFRDPKTFFPTINKFFRRKEAPTISNILINKNNPILIDELKQSEELTELNDDQYIITKETSKLNIIGKQFEIINSPRYTNLLTDIKNTADNCADEIKNSIQANRQNNSTITNFSNENRAFYPSIDQDAPKIFHSFITTSILLKKAKNKTSSGTDNIPMIVLKNLPEQFIKDYTAVVLIIWEYLSEGNKPIQKINRVRLNPEPPGLSLGVAKAGWVPLIDLE
ncbi:Similar to RTase: Probable RNA-directed DNA polymerase from transposon BS (Drosophila melanogaster) [Cotesia congregata]|uniref:Similar to RTase: Probable RNA-directed DNA polymerase from transposon BS (Drosophila melanogaster) n=1 Tax=Cotesia congregata TaxID=51543 RepID=A0A8J2MMJ1_COTCN|nr:Similar to RTase: Probable RNA-directed DNA polymerase from transposon BS (Drosophila melanogaster) [Cotesia congregata]